jgi:hypothetical protein
MTHESKTKKWQIEAKPTWHAGPRSKSGKTKVHLLPFLTPYFLLLFIE